MNSDLRIRLRAGMIYRGVTMTINLNLPPELEDRLRLAAAQAGMSADAMTLRLLDTHLPDKERRDQALALLRSWMEADDEQDQSDTWQFLVKALDADRAGGRKLFPQDLKGVSW